MSAPLDEYIELGRAELLQIHKKLQQSMNPDPDPIRCHLLTLRGGYLLRVYDEYRSTEALYQEANDRYDALQHEFARVSHRLNGLIERPEVPTEQDVDIYVHALGARNLVEYRYDIAKAQLLGYDMRRQDASREWNSVWGEYQRTRGEIAAIERAPEPQLHASPMDYAARYERLRSLQDRQRNLEYRP